MYIHSLLYSLPLLSFLSMNWDGLGEDDDEDHFFEACQRVSSVDPLDLGSSESDDNEEFEDSRMSFVSTISSASIKGIRSIQSISKPSCVLGGYDMWMAEPGDIKERRKRLLQGMGLASNKDLLKIASTKIVRAISIKPKVSQVPTSKADSPCPVHPMAGNVSENRPPLAEISPMPSDRQVVDWTDIHEMVTAACYTPDGQGAVIGSHQGSCHIYTIDDRKLEHRTDIQTQKKSQVKIPGFQTQTKGVQAQAEKITGLQYAPTNPSELLITSANSRIRIYNDSELVQKFRGFRNTSSQISASFSPDGRHVISASEDSQVYIWKAEDSKNIGAGKGRSRVTIQANEHFHCKDVSVAIPWPGSVKTEPPVVELHSKRHSKRSSAPPLPPSVSSSPTRDDNLVGASSRRHLPPLPKKNNNALERIPSCVDEEIGQSGHIDPGIGVSESFGASSQSISYGDSPSISASGTSPSQYWSTSWSLFDNGSAQNQTIQATAWGLVIVTASLEGEIRVFQNFGLPVKVSRQTQPKYEQLHACLKY